MKTIFNESSWVPFTCIPRSPPSENICGTMLVTNLPKNGQRNAPTPNQEQFRLHYHFNKKIIPKHTIELSKMPSTETIRFLFNFLTERVGQAPMLLMFLFSQAGVIISSFVFVLCKSISFTQVTSQWEINVDYAH